MLEIKIKNVKNHATEAQKILAIANNAKTKLLEFSYSKEGIAELFESVQKRIIEEPPKKELSKVKKKVKKWKL